MKKKKESLIITHPELSQEWHPTKNGDLTPSDVTYGSSKKVWWQCEKGHEWEAKVHHRTDSKKPTNCPICSGNKANVLATTHPELSKEWHPIKNGDLIPDDVTYGSDKKVWWQCEKGHEWEAKITNRTNSKNLNKCPVCIGRKVVKGYNDLATLKPEIAKTWHPTKNGSLTPYDFVIGSGKDIWWICPHCNIEYMKSIKSQVSRQKCPICKHKR
ncbi:MAG: zinc-ribbon domain-containing protein [Clostridium sp.]|nr:zinc-ribbon domain-containing protein [Clostridium sp.]